MAGRMTKMIPMNTALNILATATYDWEGGGEEVIVKESQLHLNNVECPLVARWCTLLVGMISWGFVGRPAQNGAPCHLLLLDSGTHRT